MNKKRFAGLIIMDGYGLAPASATNAVSLANKPFLDEAFKKYPNNVLQASGEAVGLPEGQMGNSEVGHLNLGAGRIVYQSLTRINKSIKDGDFYKSPAFLEAIDYVKKHHSQLHIFGLASEGGVHSYTTHIQALRDLAEKHEVSPWFHAFMDGRDTPQTSGKGFIEGLVNNNVKVATVSGRYYAMDRDNNWDRIQAAYDNMTLGTGKHFTSAAEGLQASYDQDITDEFVKPFVVDEKGLIKNNDAIIFANFRPDRAIRIATAFSNPEATKLYEAPGKATFDASKAVKNIFFVSMMHYNESVKGPIAFGLQTLENIYGEVIANNGLTQLRIAETEKYAHITFFFDGGKEREFKGSTRILVQSPKVATYDLQPEMSAFEVRDKAVEAIKSNKFDTMILNFANPDMVGHTGNIEAAKIAVETVDQCVGDVVEAIESIGGVAIIIADHGNAEMMVTPDGKVHTAHTTNIVPVIVTDSNLKIGTGSLSDVAPTLLEILGVEQPKEMTGHSLIIK